MVTKNISMRFQHSPIKTVGGVRKSTKKCLKITSFWPGTEKRKIAQPRNLYPEVTFTPIHLLVKFRDDRTSGTWSKSGNRQTSIKITGWASLTWQQIAVQSLHKFLYNPGLLFSLSVCYLSKSVMSPSLCWLVQIQYESYPCLHKYPFLYNTFPIYINTT